MRIGNHFSSLSPATNAALKELSEAFQKLKSDRQAPVDDNAGRNGSSSGEKHNRNGSSGSSGGKGGSGEAPSASLH